MNATRLLHSWVLTGLLLPQDAPPGVAVVEAEAWIRLVERRVEAWRGVSIDPPLPVVVLDERPEVLPDEHLPADDFTTNAVVLEAFRLSRWAKSPHVADAPGPTAFVHGGGIAVFSGRTGASWRVDATRATVRALLDRHHARPGPSVSLPPPRSSDEALARAALREGEARWITALVLGDLANALAEAVAGEEDLASLLAPVAEARAPLAEARAPLAEARRRLLFVEGESLVRAVHARGGFSAVDAAFVRPPSSTEQVLHPRRAFVGARDEPTAVATPALEQALPAGYARLAAATLGEFGTYEFLRLEGDPVRAVKVADGWDGDLVLVYGRGNERVLCFDSCFDSDADAAELVDALRKVFERRYHRAVAGDGYTISKDAAFVRVVVTGEDGRTRSAATREGARVRWVDVSDPGVDVEALLAAR